MDVFSGTGRVIAMGMAAVARVTDTKPMHPSGVVSAAVLERHGRATPVGVPWLDEPGSDDAVLRLSRSFGLPSVLPDVLGFALRVPGERPVDLLLSTTGSGRWSRLVFLPRHDAGSTYGSVMAFSSPAGSVRLAAWATAGLPSAPDELAVRVAGGGVEFVLAAAVGTGDAEPFARVRVTGLWAPLDPPLHFDAVRHAPPGLPAAGPIARMRVPAYAAARDALGDPLGDGAPAGHARPR
ncbi:phosphodiesterase [Goekera deserti]|nr:phosphodiesterase [Goekera deserti]